jgi:hypothetical protein
MQDLPTRSEEYPPPYDQRLTEAALVSDPARLSHLHFAHPKCDNSIRPLGAGRGRCDFAQRSTRPCEWSYSTARLSEIGGLTIHPMSFMKSWSGGRQIRLNPPERVQSFGCEVLGQARAFVEGGDDKHW